MLLNRQSVSGEAMKLYAVLVLYKGGDDVRQLKVVWFLVVCINVSLKTAQVDIAENDKMK